MIVCAGGHQDPDTPELPGPADIREQIDATQVRQIVMNLIQNAIDALKGREDAEIVVWAGVEDVTGNTTLKVPLARSNSPSWPGSSKRARSPATTAC